MWLIALRVLPGQVLRELVENDRIIGGLSPNCSSKAVDLYRAFVAGDCLITDSRTAEMVKLTENACRDVQVVLQMNYQSYVMSLISTFGS